MLRANSVAAAALWCVACAPAPVKPDAAARDESSEAWYATAVKELREINGKADASFANGKLDAAAALIGQAEPVSARLLSVPRPTLAAEEAVSDLDDLYGRMLFRNRHYGWARLQFQKNAVRWKHWHPRNDETNRRLAAAQNAIDRCDRALVAR